MLKIGQNAPEMGPLTPQNPFFILEKYGNPYPYQNPTASIKSCYELGSRVPPQFSGLPMGSIGFQRSLICEQWTTMGSNELQWAPICSIELQWF